MTEIIQFLFNNVRSVMELMKSFEFELFGYRVNFLMISVSLIAIYLIVNFLRLGFNVVDNEMNFEKFSHKSKVNENAQKNDRNTQAIVRAHRQKERNS